MTPPAAPRDSLPTATTVRVGRYRARCRKIAAMGLTKFTRTGGLRRQAGPDDGRMYGMSDPGYQGRLRGLTERQEASNKQVDMERYKSREALFTKGIEATENTAEQAACISELVWLIKQGRTTIAVQQWSEQMMGRAAMAVNQVHGYAAVYVGDCAQVADLHLNRGRPQGSAYIAQHWLRCQFPERSQQGSYKDKAHARKVLAEEIRQNGWGRTLCFLDAATLRFQDYDWAEAKHVASACDAIVIVSVKCRAEAPTDVPYLAAPEEQIARPRKHLKRALAEVVQNEQSQSAKPVEPTEPEEAPKPKRQLTPLERDVVEILSDPAAMRRITKPRRQEQLVTLRRMLDDLEYCGRYSGVRRQLPPQARELLRKGRAILEEGGDYVSDSEEDEAGEDTCDPVQLPGHHWRCCEHRCVCVNSSAVGSGDGKTRRWG